MVGCLETRASIRPLSVRASSDLKEKKKKEEGRRRRRRWREGGEGEGEGEGGEGEGKGEGGKENVFTVNLTQTAAIAPRPSTMHPEHWAELDREERFLQ